MGFQVLQCKYALPLLAVSMIVCGTFQEATANTETPVFSADGYNPYLVVIRDTVGVSKRSPGVHYRNKEGTWDSLVAGDV